MDNLRIIKIYEDRNNKLHLSKQEEKDILSIKNIIGDKNVILQADGKLNIKHYVGFIQVNKTRLLIYPKITMYSQDEDKYHKSLQILFKLLAYTGFKGVKRIPSPQNLGRYKGDLLELFISIFIDEILYQFKIDLNRNYKEKVENQTFIKGKLNFPETIKKNAYRKHLHYVQFQEFSEDILLNQIFKTVINNLFSKTTIKENRLKLRQGLIWLKDVTPINITNEIWDQVEFTRLNRQYQAAFNLAKLFYYNYNPKLYKGNDKTFSFLVPLNTLFENYLYKVIKNSNIQGNIVTYQGPRKYLSKVNGQRKMELIPDITIAKDNHINYIIDAKYKESCFLPSDIYQMLTYSIRYKCSNIAIIYPKYLDDKDSTLVSNMEIMNYDRKINIKSVKVDLDLEPEVLGNKLIDLLNDS